MAKSNLLNTTTATLLDLLGSGKVYSVPAYQRDYSWEEDQWEDLWSDIEELSNSPDSKHYMGALVVQARTDREFLVIDGQQRIATLSVIALAAISVIRDLGADPAEKEANRQRATELRNRFVGEKNPASLVETSKLFLNQTDNEFYQDYLVQLKEPLNLRKLPKSNRLLWGCFTWFKSKLVARNASGEAIARLLLEAVARQLLFILITVEDDLNAYTVFETLNARGMELSATDLLKNYLFSKVAAGPDLDSLQRRWRSVLATVRQERFPDFLRYHLLCENNKIRKERLFKLIRAEVQTPAHVFTLMDALEARAELFAAIDDAEHEYWIDVYEAKPIIRELNIFQVKQMTPLLFAAWEKLSKPDFVRILKLVSVISFRYTVIGSLNTNELEPVYHRAAKALLIGDANSPAQVFEILRSVYVSDEDFQNNFEGKSMDSSGQRKKVLKYILCTFEADAAGKACSWETDPGSIEHVLPQNPSDQWDALIPQDRQDEFVYRIGNMTLLEAGINRELGNAAYSTKRDAYAGSSYELTKAIANQAPEEWTIPYINERQKALAQRAVHLWRSPFA